MSDVPLYAILGPLVRHAKSRLRYLGAHPWSPFTRGGPVLDPYLTCHAGGQHKGYWSYWSFNEQSTSATPVGCPWTQRLDGHRCGSRRATTSGEGVIFDPQQVLGPCRGTSLTRNIPPVGPYRSPMMVLEGWVFLMSEVPLYHLAK